MGRKSMSKFKFGSPFVFGRLIRTCNREACVQPTGMAAGKSKGGVPGTKDRQEEGWMNEIISESVGVLARASTFGSYFVSLKKSGWTL